MKRRSSYRPPVTISRTAIVLALLTVATLAYALGVLIVMLLVGVMFK